MNDNKDEIYNILWAGCEIGRRPIPGGCVVGAILDLTIAVERRRRINTKRGGAFVAPKLRIASWFSKSIRHEAHGARHTRPEARGQTLE